jgi:transcriptional regulator with GAF, ATPase, and Fis domain
VVNILVPPLRERVADIPLLVDYFIRKYCNSMNRPLVSIEQSALKRLSEYPFPGNIRELETWLNGPLLLAMEKRTN